MKFSGVCWKFYWVIAVALTATFVDGAPISVLQVEGDFYSDTGLQYAPVNFAGASTYGPDSYEITYHALSDPGSSTISTYSGHAKKVRDRLVAADGPTNLVSDIYCLYAGDFLNNYVQTNNPSSNAFRPNPVSNGIKIVNHSWVYSYEDTAADIDAVRRMDYMIRREDLVMTCGAVSPYGDPSVPTPLTWASRNGIAVRGTQGFDPTLTDGIGKGHADLWGPKTDTGDDEVSSYETPGVAGYAAALIDVADGNGWNNGINGLRHEVVKSVLMTGADKTAFTTTSGGFNSWTSNGVNNLDNVNGAGRADYDASLAVLTGGPQSMATVTGNTVIAPVVTTASAGWWYEDSISAYGDQALVLDLTDDMLTDLTATLIWDVTQQEVSGNRLDTTDDGVIFANLDLELLPVTFDGGTYTLGSSLGYAGLMSQSTDDNVEHLYFTDALDPGFYAFLVSNNSDFAWDYGFSYGFTAVPEPGTLGLLIALLVSMCCLHRAKLFRGDIGKR